MATQVPILNSVPTIPTKAYLFAQGQIGDMEGGGWFDVTINPAVTDYGSFALRSPGTAAYALSVGLVDAGLSTLHYAPENVTKITALGVWHGSPAVCEFYFVGGIGVLASLAALVVTPVGGSPVELVSGVKFRAYRVLVP